MEPETHSEFTVSHVTSHPRVVPGVHACQYFFGSDADTCTIDDQGCECGVHESRVPPPNRFFFFFFGSDADTFAIDDHHRWFPRGCLRGT